MSRREIKWRKKTNSTLVQIYDAGLEYCWISRDYSQASRFVMCKDFLSDAFWSQLHGRRTEVYDFDYDPEKWPKIDHKTCRIAVANSSDKRMFSHAQGMLDFVSQWSKRLGMKKSRLVRCSNPPSRYAKGGVFVLESDGRWLSSPPMLSLLALFVRVGMSHTGGSAENTARDMVAGKVKQYQDEDREQLYSAQSAIRLLERYGPRKCFSGTLKDNWPGSADIDDIHESCGIVAFAKGDSRRIVPRWYKGAGKLLPAYKGAGKLLPDYW